MSQQLSLESLIDNLKSILDFGKKSFIGIDIGLSSIKIAQIQKKKNGGFKLINAPHGKSRGQYCAFEFARRLPFRIVVAIGTVASKSRRP